MKRENDLNARDHFSYCTSFLLAMGPRKWETVSLNDVVVESLPWQLLLTKSDRTESHSLNQSAKTLNGGLCFLISITVVMVPLEKQTL